MNIRQLRQFVAIADSGSFRKAAEQLHMAQPPLSMAIKRLENELGAALFDRSTAGVRLTPAGTAILGDARQLLFHADQIERATAQASEGLRGTLRIGFVGSATYTLFPKALPLFRERYPLVTLDMRERTTTEILREVEANTLDLGLVRYPVTESSRVLLTPVEQDELVVALPASHLLASKVRLALKDLKDQPFIMYSSTAAPNLFGQIMLACQAAGFVPTIVQEAVQVQTLISLVESGLGLALVPSVSKRQASHSVVFRKLASPGFSLAVAIAVATRLHAEPQTAVHFRLMLEELRAVAL